MVKPLSMQSSFAMLVIDCSLQAWLQLIWAGGIQSSVFPTGPKFPFFLRPCLLFYGSDKNTGKYENTGNHSQYDRTGYGSQGAVAMATT